MTFIAKKNSRHGLKILFFMSIMLVSAYSCQKCPDHPNWDCVTGLYTCTDDYFNGGVGGGYPGEIINKDDESNVLIRNFLNEPGLSVLASVSEDCTVSISDYTVKIKGNTYIISGSAQMMDNTLALILTFRLFNDQNVTFNVKYSMRRN